jgi:hypothetical protein
MKKLASALGFELFTIVIALMPFGLVIALQYFLARHNRAAEAPKAATACAACGK